MGERACQCRQPDCFTCELEGTRGWLAAQGLHIVTAGDKAVLEACDAMPMQSLLETELDSEITPDWYLALARAELSRREKAKP